MDLIVLIALMASAPASMQAFAQGTISVILGVILAINGNEEPRLHARTYFAQSSGFVPTSLPMA